MTRRWPISLVVNGASHRVLVAPNHTLVDVLRHQLGLTGTHVGCEHGICGACTVLVDGEPTRACLMFGVQADGAEIETVEGLAAGPELSPLQKAFSKHRALQCGFCTPGFLVLAEGLLRKEGKITDAEIRDCVASNLCRCTGYQGIVDAIRETAAGR